MLKALNNAVIEWNRETNERQKLQHTYLAVVVISVIIAGIVSLVNNDSGQKLLRITVFAGVVFLANALVWNLLESTIIARISGRRKRQ